MKSVNLKISNSGKITQEVEYKHLKANYPYTYSQLASCLSLEFGNISYGDVWNYVNAGKLPEKYGNLRLNKIGKRSTSTIFIESRETA